MADDSKEVDLIPPGGGVQPGVPRLYVNNVELTATALDLNIEFGFQRGNDPAEPLIHLVMAWEEGEILRGFLEDTLEQYEQIVGPIRRMDEPAQPGEGGDEHDADHDS